MSCAWIRWRAKRWSFKPLFGVVCAVFLLNMLFDITDSPTVVYTSTSHDAYIMHHVRRRPLPVYEERQDYAENIVRLQSVAARRRDSDHLRHVDCPAMFRGDEAAIERGREYADAHARRTLSNDDYTSMAANCTRFVETRGYITRPLSQEEYEFPIAFSILMFDGVEQVDMSNSHLKGHYMGLNPPRETAKFGRPARGSTVST